MELLGCMDDSAISSQGYDVIDGLDQFFILVVKDLELILNL